MVKQSRWLYAIVGTFVLLFAGLVYAWSVLSMPIAKEFAQWTQSQLSLTFTLVMAFFCIGGFVGGLLLKKIGPKLIVLISGVLFLLGFFIASWTQQIAVLYLGFGVCCGFASGFSYNATMSTISRWFPDRQGLISGILLMGFGIGSFLIGKVYQAATPETVGAWRGSFRVIGVIICVIFAVCAFFYRRPGADFIPPAGGKAKKQSKVLAECAPTQVLRSPAFWLFFVWAILLSAAGLCLISQASGVAREVGADISAGTIATVVGLISVFNGLGRVLFGGMFDRIGRRLTMQCVNIAFIITSVILIVALKTGSFPLLVVGFICGGLSYSGVTPTNSAFMNTYFGPKHFAVNLSLVNMNLLIASFGSTVAGALFDSTKSYLSVYLLMIGLAAGGIVLSLGISILDAKRK